MTLVHSIKTNMRNRLMSFYDKMMLRKRYIIETINDLLKNKVQLIHSRHRSITNFFVNLVSVLGAYCLFDN
ncbi:MAG: transposase [Roseburia sp.]|nr:transposase [Roseburia sp.]